MQTTGVSCRTLSRSVTLAISVIVGLMLSACGSDGKDGAQGPPGPSGVPPTAFNMTITRARVQSAPVVDFTVTDQSGMAYSGLVANDLRFTIAKLTPGEFGSPSTWQNYVVTTQTASAEDAPNFGTGTTFLQGTRETPDANAAAGQPGSLVSHGDGTYTYYFKTDITTFTKDSCPLDPCNDALGNPLDLSYDGSLTHRVGIQTRGSVPMVNATFDFVPAGGAVTVERDIVKTANCNQCHNKLEAHDERIETKYCVTCHNPGSADPDSGNTVDFKVFIHKLHRGMFLHQVVDGGKYAIWGYNNTEHDFSDVEFPQEIRNCTKCHDGTGTAATNPRWTPQGNAWMIPNRQACSSCHDDIDFTKPLGDPAAHPGGPQADDSLCATCHDPDGGLSVALVHGTFTWQNERAKFKFNILRICGKKVNQTTGLSPTLGIAACATGGKPTVTFSVTDPTNGNKAYDILNDPEFTDSNARLRVDIAWDTRDYNNTGGSGARPARAEQWDALAGGDGTETEYGQDSATPAYAPAVDNGDGTFTMTAGTALPSAAQGTGVVALEGRAYSQDTLLPADRTRIPIKGAVAYFGITDATPKARRVVVDAETKCDKCHDQLEQHGGTRADNAQLCVICHNPNNTDAESGDRPKFANGLVSGVGTLDEKKEESIDFKRMIHGIHAGAKTHLADGSPAHGFREKGMLVTNHDYSEMRFPGILNDCHTCHLEDPDTMTLEDRSASGGANWEAPAQNGILGSTIDATPGVDDTNTPGEVNAALQTATDNSRISPTAAVCSSCHDDAPAQSHMELNGALFGEPLGSMGVVTQTMIDTNVESCEVCHGSGKAFDVEVVHEGGGGE
jgi:OmcA/MtrC family decaheme c-type cytochrome